MRLCEMPILYICSVSFKVGEIGLATSYVGDNRVRKLVWHMLSFAHIPLARHPEAEEIVRQLVESFMSEVRDIINVSM